MTDKRIIKTTKILFAGIGIVPLFAQAGIITLDAATYNYNDEIDLNGDGAYDYNLRARNFNDNFSAYPNSPTASGQTAERTYENHQEFSFGSNYSNLWTSALLTSGSTIDEHSIFSGNSSDAIYLNDKLYTQSLTSYQSCFKGSCNYSWGTSTTLSDSSETWGALRGRGLMGLSLDVAGETRFGWIDVEFGQTSMNIFGGAIADIQNRGIIAGEQRLVSSASEQNSTSVPEPSSIAILATGLAMGAVARRRKLRAKAVA